MCVPLCWRARKRAFLVKSAEKSGHEESPRTHGARTRSRGAERPQRRCRFLRLTSAAAAKKKRSGCRSEARSGGISPRPDHRGHGKLPSALAAAPTRSGAARRGATKLRAYVAAWDCSCGEQLACRNYALLWMGHNCRGRKIGDC